MPESSDTPNEQFLKPTEPTDFGKHIIDKARSGPDSGEPTMSSHEIAELCEKDHKVVIRDIRSMLISLYGDEHVERIIPEHYRNRHSEFIRENAGQLLNAIAGDGTNRVHDDSRGFRWERDARGYVTRFDLDKEHALTLVAGYNVKLRKRIIDRWQQLEQRAPTVDPILALNDPTTLRALLLDNVEERMKLAQELAAAAPKLEAFDRIASAEGSLCITDAAKSLQVRPKSLFDFLRAHGWIYQPHGGRGDIAYATKLQQGLMEHKTTTVHRSDGSEKIITQARITPKGLTRLAQEFPSPVKLAA